jgi:hypothetical protein
MYVLSSLEYEAGTEFKGKRDLRKDEGAYHRIDAVQTRGPGPGLVVRSSELSVGRLQETLRHLSTDAF